MNLGRVIALMLLGLMLLGLGCAPKTNDPKKAKVQGKVTLDGKDLQTGKIVFESSEGGVPPSVLTILDGKYEGTAAVGTNKVRLQSLKKFIPKEKGFDGPGADQPSERNILPKRYGAESDITRDVSATGDNTFNFDIKSE